MITQSIILSLFACILPTGVQAAPVMPSGGATEQESQSQGPEVEGFIRDFLFPRWDIVYQGLYTPPGGTGCFYNPLDLPVTCPLSCHRPTEVCEIDCTFEARVEFSVEREGSGEDALEIDWEKFKLALWAKEGFKEEFRIGATYKIEYKRDIVPDECYNAEPWAYPPYQCLIFDVTWHALDWEWEKTARVYLYRPALGDCLVWTGAEFQPTCDGCDEYYPPPPNGNWFCGGHDAAEPVWADWCDDDCTDDPLSVECDSFVPDPFLDLEDVILSVPQAQQQAAPEAQEQEHRRMR